MKKKNIFTAAALMTAIAWVVIAACTKDSGVKTIKIYTPILKPSNEVRASIKTSDATAIVATGKMFLFGHYIFLNEVNKGIHIIDNSNPSAPVNKAFISIPGNLDISIKGNTLYADSYGDLLVIDVTDLQKVQYKTYFHNIFPDRQYILGNLIPDDQVVVDWTVRDTTENLSVAPGQGIWKNHEYYTSVTGIIPGGINVFYTNSYAGAGKSSTGTAGSTSRFAIMNNYLYTVGTFQLSAFNITNEAAPTLENTFSTVVTAQTIFSVNNKLFIGGTNGINIYSVDNASSPHEEGMFGHFCSVDPVIADDSTAYVTLHTGDQCDENVDELQVLDISNIQQPKLIQTYKLTNPDGLSKDGNLLFICDGASGLKIFNAANAAGITLIKAINVDHPYDVICYNKVAFVSAKSGLYQYDYSDINNIKLLSRIDL